LACPEHELPPLRLAAALRLITAVEAAQLGVPQTAVERRCATCREPFAVALEENDRLLLAVDPAPECPACESLMAMHFPPLGALR